MCTQGRETSIIGILAYSFIIVNEDRMELDEGEGCC